MNDMENLRTFADQLWKYMVPKLDSKFASNVSYFRAQVVSNPGNNKLEVQRPVENGTLTLPCVRAMSGAQAGQQVVALVMGSMSNAIVVGDGNLNVPGGGGDAGIANFQSQPDGSLVITLTDGTTFTATPVINAFANVQVGSTTITADNRADTLTLVAGDNVTLTPNAANGSVTIAATDTTYSSKAAASGGTAVSLVTTGEKYTWNNKQNKLTFDTTPTAGSSNPVTSEGIKTAMDGKSDTSHTHDNLYYKLTNGTAIPSGADLNDATYRTPGNYICETNAKAHTIKHFPGYDGTTLVNTKANAFKLFVGYAQGVSNYIAQELRDYYTGAVYYRWWYNSSWQAWRAVRGTASILISELDTITNNIKDSTLISTSDANGETGIWYKRAATTFWNYIKSKADAVYAAINHTHAASDIASGTLAAARLPTATASAQGAVKLGASGGAAAYRHTHSANDVTDLVTATAYGPAELVSFQDAHGGLPLKKCLVSIMPAQSGSGNPTPANVRPISGREHVKVWRFGKNFFPQADVKLRTHEGNKTVDFPHPLPAGTYTFSADLTSTYNGNCLVHIIRGDGTSIQFSLTPGTRVSGSFTSAGGNEIIGIRFYIGDGYNTSYNNSGAWSNIQVETGSTATAYEASETVVDADLPELVYGGTLDVLTGKLTVTHGYIKPTEYTGSDRSDTMVVVFARIPLGKHGINYNIVSNVATGAAQTDANIARYGYVVRQNISGNTPLLFIAASTTAHPTTASLSQALLDADACFAYELETPEVYQLTPSQVASLAGQNHIWADTGNITVEYGAFLQALEGAVENHTHALPGLPGILPVTKGGTGNSTGYVTAGQKSGTTLGEKATAEGIDTLSTGRASHSEGIASSASGVASHSEGVNCVAKGEYSHAEGNHTIAAKMCQHVFGLYNKEDTSQDASAINSNSLIEIVGGGYGAQRKNIRELRYSGNEWIAGTLTQASDARLKDVQGEIPDVSGIRAVRFKWNAVNGEHDEKDHIGYLAQEVEAVAPYLVGEDSNGYKSLDYIALLCAKVEMLEREIEKLKQ